MILPQKLQEINLEMSRELSERILPFWMERAVDYEHEGFYGRIANDLKVYREAEKGCILNSRILWTFASAYRMLKNEAYLAIAKRAFEYLLNYFWDEQYAGLFFMVDFRGRVTCDRKQVYNLAFGIYGLSEYYRATGEREALNRAIRLFHLIEEHCYDQANRGYLEACARDWSLTDELRLSPKDLNEKKSMNTHLHLLEAYTNLFRVWQDERLREKLRELLKVMLTRVIDPETNHFKLFFDERWNSKAEIVSFGHDIEGSWLLCDAAEALGDEQLLGSVRERAVEMARKVYEEGIDTEYGGLYNEVEVGMKPDTRKIWWPQCEAVVGFINAHQLTGREDFSEAAFQIWRFCDRFLLDKIYGEWFYSVTREGSPIQTDDKVGPWKCPYHNGRACMEVMSRLGNIKLK